MIRDFIRFSIDILTWLIILRAILSWFPTLHRQTWYRSLVDITETFVSPVRKILPASNMMIDFAPLITIFLLQLIENVLMGLL